VQYLELGVVGNCRLAIDARHGNLKDAVLVLLHGGSIAVPVVEVADKVGAQGVGGPFAVDDVAVVADLEAKLLVAPRELFEAALCVVNGLYPLLGFCVAALEGALEGIEVGVELADAWMVSRWTGSIAGGQVKHTGAVIGAIGGGVGDGVCGGVVELHDMMSEGGEGGEGR
jgi:hypothetical protein